MSSRCRRQRPKTTTATRHGAPHPVRRMLAEDKLETQEIVIEPEEVQAQPEGWKKISEERTSQLDWVAPKIIKRVYHSSALCEGRTLCHRTTAATTD